MEIEGVVGNWVIDGVNESEQYLMSVCAEKAWFLASTLQHKFVPRYTWIRGDESSLLDT